MKIALIMENSQAAKSQVVHNALTSVAEPAGHEVHHYGMYAADDDAQLTYVMNGILAGILINSGAADFIVSGCGTGMGAMLGLNAMPNVVCGLVIDPTDAFLFGQINDGNAISMPYAKGFGWAGELNIRYIFEKAFTGERGQGYPLERAEPQQRNATILNEVKAAVVKDNFIDSLRSIDQDLVKTAVGSERFQQCFFEHCQNPDIADYVRSLLD